MGVINPMLHHNESEWASEKPLVVESERPRQSRTLWGFVVLLAAALGALGYYGYHMIKDQDAQITQVFGSQGTLTTLGQRADAAEAKLHDLAGGWQDVGQRVTKLEGRVAADAGETRRYADKLMQQLHQQMTAEMDSRTSALDARLNQLESEQADQRAKMAQTEANLKQEISSVREENGRDLSGVRQQEEANARDVNALSHKFDQRRIDFELAKGQAKELAPGILLRVQGTKPSRERYHGVLSLAQDHRTVWLRDQSAHEPVRFVPKDGGDPYELVVTDVTKKAVVGYLLAPVKRDADASAGAAVGQQTSTDNSARD